MRSTRPWWSRWCNLLSNRSPRFTERRHPCVGCPMFREHGSRRKKLWIRRIGAPTCAGPFALQTVRESCCGIRAQSGASRPVVSSMRHALAVENDREHWLAALGQLWIRNVPVHWKGVYDGQRRLRVSLPTYPFERQRYWIEPAKTVPTADESTAPKRKQDPADWFYVPSWKRVVAAPAQEQNNGATLVFAAHGTTSAGVISGLRA